MTCGFALACRCGIRTKVAGSSGWGDGPRSGARGGAPLAIWNPLATGIGRPACAQRVAGDHGHQHAVVVGGSDELPAQQRRGAGGPVLSLRDQGVLCTGSTRVDGEPTVRKCFMHRSPGVGQDRQRHTKLQHHAAGARRFARSVTDPVEHRSQIQSTPKSSGREASMRTVTARQCTSSTPDHGFVVVVTESCWPRRDCRVRSDRGA